MPVSRTAVAAAGGDPRLDIRGYGLVLKHVPANSSTRLRPLGDVIPMPIAAGVQATNWSGSVVSVGDLILLPGIMLLIAAAMTSGDGGAHARAARARAPETSV
jgi:hypothetical protein